MRAIPLVNHPWYALVDDEDFERFAGANWYAVMPYGYVHRTVGNRTIYLHREILNAPVGMEVDHINRHPLDCRRANLRLATSASNKWNTAKRVMRAGRPIHSRYKGVYWHTRSKLWQARLHIHGKTLSLRYHKTEEEAARAYDRAAAEHFGEFAWFNFPNERRSA